MLVLGLGGSVHDFSTCLVKDNKIISAIEEERLSRIKHHNIGKIKFNQMFYQGVDYCLEATGYKMEDIDKVYGNDLIYPKFLENFEDINLFNHHLTHAASGFYNSPYKSSAILVVDGIGTISQNLNAETVSYYRGDNNEITKIHNYVGKVKLKKTEREFSWNNFLFAENSIGSFYSFVTEMIGFDRFEEGKTMGLAPYGKTSYLDIVNEFVGIDNNANFLFTYNDLLCLKKFIKSELKKANTDHESFQIKADIAYATQSILENNLIMHGNLLYEKTGLKNLCLSGGVAMNCVANYKILQETPFENIFVYGAAGDNGTAIGAALLGYYKDNPKLAKSGRANPGNIYSGKLYSSNEVKDSLTEFKLKGKIVFKKCQDISMETAKLISNGNVIGWFQGRSEFGARALGNRSILADPRDRNMKDKINYKVKNREGYRPFAPSVLHENQNEYFSINSPVPHMTIVSPIKSEKIPSVTHVDRTGRLQTVQQNINPKYHSLIQDFYSITGVPVLLNTSFNEREPIVETPTDAIKCFLRTNIDYLVIDDYLIKRVGG